MTDSISARLRALSYHIDETGLVDDVDAKSCTEAADHIDTQSAMIKVLVEALIKVLPHVNTAREARQHAANERQDTPALDAVMVAHAVLTAAKDTT